MTTTETITGGENIWKDMLKRLRTTDKTIPTAIEERNSTAKLDFSFFSDLDFALFNVYR